jgi:hypothetical protein
MDCRDHTRLRSHRRTRHSATVVRVSVVAAAAAGHTAALDTSQVKSLGLLAIVAVILIGLLIARLVTKIITRLVVVVLVVVFGAAIYQQRGKALDAATSAAQRCDVTFFGIHIQPSDPTVKKACAALGKP